MWEVAKVLTLTSENWLVKFEYKNGFFRTIWISIKWTIFWPTYVLLTSRLVLNRSDTQAVEIYLFQFEIRCFHKRNENFRKSSAILRVVGHWHIATINAKRHHMERKIIHGFFDIWIVHCFPCHVHLECGQGVHWICRVHLLAICDYHHICLLFGCDFQTNAAYWKHG